jgi:formylmethanofuran dehydrogenase subunit E
MLSNDLLDGAVRFHGHLGPFLILGLRAGLLGINYLGKNYLELSATVKTTLNPPRSCFIDGIQFSSGCTSGKGNIEVKASNDVSVEFFRGERRINITVRNNVLETLDMLNSTQVEDANKEIIKKSDEELFLVKRSR